MTIFKRNRIPEDVTPAQPPARPSVVAPRTTFASPAAGSTPGASPAPEMQVPDSQQAEPAANPKPKGQPQVSPALSRENAAVIDQHSQLTGTLHSSGNVLIEGIFEGDIEAKDTILVEQFARAKCQLSAKDVVISGSFDGTIVCQGRLHITATATISGEVNTPVLVVEDGSTVNCHFKMARPGRTN